VADKKEELIPTNELFEHPEKFPSLVETTIHVEELDSGPGIRAATPAETAALNQPKAGAFDFINAYVNYADVLEAPPEAHEAVATELIASAICEKVLIRHGAVKIPLDLWLLLLSGSGFGRNTLLTLAQPVLEAAKLKGLIRKATWGSRVAFYQSLAEQPYGLFIWPELSVILKKFEDKSFAGTKEWLTDLYDNLETPEPVRYRVTGKKSDTPPIVFDHAPRLNILATSSVDWFLSNITQEDALGGFVPRWVLKKIGGGRVVPIPRRPDESLIAPLAEHLCKASELRGEANFSGVHQYYDLWYRQTHRRFAEHPNASLAMPFFNRLRTHVLKLALIYEVSQSLSLVVGRKAMARAIRAAKASEESIFALLATGLSREGAEVDRMADVVRRGGPEGMSRSELTRIFQHLRNTERESRLSTLLDAKLVHRFWRETSGRSAGIFVHKEYLAEYKRRHPQDNEA
jgi:hypothetical protein